MKVYRLWKRINHCFDQASKTWIDEENDPQNRKQEDFFQKDKMSRNVLTVYATPEAAARARAVIWGSHVYDIVEYDLLERN